MTTVTLWLLISFGVVNTQAARPTTVVERFATVEECQRVAVLIQKVDTRVQCIQTTIVK